MAVWSQLRHDNVATFYGLTFSFGEMPGIVSPFIAYDLMAYTEHLPQERLKLVDVILCVS
jgi:hypothetical protein